MDQSGWSKIVIVASRVASLPSCSLVSSAFAVCGAGGRRAGRRRRAAGMVRGTRFWRGVSAISEEDPTPNTEGDHDNMVAVPRHRSKLPMAMPRIMNAVIYH